MLKFSEIKQMYEDNIELEVDARKLAGWIYLSEVEIAKAYGPIGETSFTAKADVHYNLPADHIATAKVRDEDGGICFDYEIDEYGRIKFGGDGNYVMLYHKLPGMIDYNNENTSPACHGLFHAAIVQFCIGKYWETKSEGIASEVKIAGNYYQEFYRQINEGAVLLKRRAFRPRIIRKVEA